MAKRKEDEDWTLVPEEPSKKLKTGDDEQGAPPIQSKATKMDGPDDGTILGLFSPLLYAINTFSRDCFKGRPYAIPGKREEKEFVETLSASGSELYLKKKYPGAKQRMVQAMVWNKLVDSLLRTPLKAYLSLPENKITNHVSDVSELYHWRTLTARFLHNSYTGSTSWGEGGAGREAFVQDTFDLLSKLSSVEEWDELQEGLEDVAQKAYEFAAAMARSGAYWVCTMEDPRVGDLHGFRIKSDRMEAVKFWDEEEKTTTVDLIVAPMLLKYGNSSGQNFHTCRVVRKAEVVTKPKKGTV